LSAAITSAAAIAQLMWGDIIPWISSATGRMTGLTEHVNDLGGVTCVALVPSLMLAMHDSTGIFRKSLLWIFSGLITTGLVLSVSISGMVAALAAFFVWGIISKTPFKKIGLLILISVVGIITISFSIRHGGSSLLDRLYDVVNQGLSFETSASRIEAYSRAWESILKNPIVGVGPGPFTGLTEVGQSVHNFVLLNWYESGVFGLLGVLIILIGFCYIGINVIKSSASNDERSMSIALFASYIAFLVIGMAQPIYFKRFGWISAALIVASYAGRRRSCELNNRKIMSTGFSK
jgi:O-antigen ligase